MFSLRKNFAFFRAFQNMEGPQELLQALKENVFLM